MVIFEFIYFNNYLLDSLSCERFKSKTLESDRLASLPPPPATCVTTVINVSKADLPSSLHGDGNGTCCRGSWCWNEIIPVKELGHCKLVLSDG